MNSSSARDLLGVRIIGTIKLISGILSLAVGIGIFRLLDRDQGEALEHFASRLRLDPQNHFVHAVISRLAGIDRAHLKAIEAGTFFYALLHMIEGTGLILGQLWAGYLVVIATSSLVPFEVFEVIKKGSSLRITILILNIAIVLYLVAKLRQEHRIRKGGTMANCS